MLGSSTWTPPHGGGSCCRWKIRNIEPLSYGVTQLVEYVFFYSALYSALGF